MAFKHISEVLKSLMDTLREQQLGSMTQDGQANTTKQESQ